MESISEAFSKCFVADFIFSLSRTIKDKNKNTGRIFIAKNRNGPDGLVYPVSMDPTRVFIEVLEPDDPAVAEAEVATKKELDSFMKETWKNLRNNYKGE